MLSAENRDRRIGQAGKITSPSTEGGMAVATHGPHEENGKVGWY